MSFLQDLRSAVQNLAHPPSPVGQSFPSPQSASAAPITGEVDEQVTITLNGSGNGTAQITPPGPRTAPSWSIENVYVSVATNALEATATLYVSRGIKSATPFDSRGQTATGSSGDTYAVALNLRPGDWLTVIWAGGDPGARATMTLKGTISV
jgi:hypothetical protein